jgi:sulfate/thiosulfate transport system permease protein
MASAALPTARARRRPGRPTGTLSLGVTTLWLSIIVLLPLAAVVVKAVGGNSWSNAFRGPGLAALELTLASAAIVAVVNAVLGLVIAWVLVRDDFPGKGIVNALIDLPFALPTIVAGLTLLVLYGPTGPLGINLAFTKPAVVMALAFVTLPFGVRAVQPVLMELDREMEQAAASLGASAWQTFVRIILPLLWPAILSGAALTFARAVGEYGSLVLLSGNVPFHTQVSSVYIYSQVESDATNTAAAASVVLLGISLLVLLGLRLLEGRGTRHERD